MLTLLMSRIVLTSLGMRVERRIGGQEVCAVTDQSIFVQVEALRRRGRPSQYDESITVVVILHVDQWSTIGRIGVAVAKGSVNKVVLGALSERI
jgi:hypothetical protein